MKHSLFNKQIQLVFPDTTVEGAEYSSNSTMPLIHSTTAPTNKNSISTEVKCHLTVPSRHYPSNPLTTQCIYGDYGT